MLSLRLYFAEEILKKKLNVLTNDAKSCILTFSPAVIARELLSPQALPPNSVTNRGIIDGRIKSKVK